MADAALNQQHSLRDSLEGLSNEITAYAQQQNETWPFVQLPLLESYAKTFFDHSKAEFVGVNNEVSHAQRDAFIRWTTDHYQSWLEESHMLQYGNLDRLSTNESTYNEYISTQSEPGFPPEKELDSYSVRIAQSPPMRAYGPTMNLNIASINGITDIIEAVKVLQNETLVTAVKPFNAVPAEEHKNFHTDSNADHPHSFMYTPIYQRVRDPDSDIVGTLSSSVAWDASMQNLLPETVTGILCVIKNDCDQTFTYKVSGPLAYYQGKGDHHNPAYDDMVVELDLSVHTHPDFKTTPGHCQYSMHIYPTEEFESDYTTPMPLTFSLAVLGTFVLVAVVVLVYDWMVQRRHRELVSTAARSNKLVSSLFPGDMKDRILEQQDGSESFGSSRGKMFKRKGSFQVANEDCEEPYSPLAKLYPETSIMFGDLEGFTKWSSSRTPEQVFALLEGLYAAFDEIASRRRVFKVETVGDCYVCATGLPTPQKE